MNEYLEDQISEKINNINISQIVKTGNMINITAQISSSQIVYKEDEDGNVTEGSKTLPISVVENIELLVVPNSPLWRLQRIF